MQIPMNKIPGLRHPSYAMILVTYEEVNEAPSLDFVKKTPYSQVLDIPNGMYRHHLSKESSFSLLQELQENGYSDYLCANMTLPHGYPQLFSIATKKEQGFGDDIEERIHESLLGLS